MQFLYLQNRSISIPIYKDIDQQKIENIKEKINIIYQQIKKNEITPKTDYLLNNSICEKTKNLENTMSKLDKLGDMSNFIPRVK